MPGIARLNFEGKLQAVAGEQGKVTETLHFDAWDVVVSYGAVRNITAKGNPEPVGRALVAQLKDNQFLVTGLFSRVDFLSTDAKKHRQFLRIQEGTSENGGFKFVRILNGDQKTGGWTFRQNLRCSEFPSPPTDLIGAERHREIPYLLWGSAVWVGCGIELA